MDPFYRDILKRAWKVVRKFPLLWIFGIFVAFLGNGGELQTLFNYIRRLNVTTELDYGWISSLIAIWNKIHPTWSGITLASLTLVIGLVIAGIFVWLIISSLGALIKGSWQADNKEKINYWQLLAHGNKHFWPLFGLNIVAKAIIYGVLILILVPLITIAFSQGNMIFNFFVVFLAFILFIPLSIIISLVTKYASAEVVFKESKFKEAFINAWRLFSANWLISVEMAIIVFVINALAALVLIIIAALLISPFFLSAIVYNPASASSFSSLVYIGISILLIISALFGALLAVFQTSVWTFLYFKIGGKEKVYSKMVRVAVQMIAKWQKRKAAKQLQ